MTDWLRLDAIVLLLAAPCVGSFLGVLIERLPAGRPIAWGRSACPSCGRRLGARDLVPLLSWVLNRGRCRYCRASLGLFYPAIEVAALGVAIWSLAVVPGWLVWVTCGLGWTLLVLAAIDWRHLILPDSLTLPLIPLGLLVAWSVNPEWLMSHVIGAVAGFVLLWAVAVLYSRLRGREGLGLGDAKLLAAAGAWLGWEGIPSVILISAAVALLAAVIRARSKGSLDPKQPLPYGPYLAGAFWLVWLYGPIGFSLVR